MDLSKNDPIPKIIHYCWFGGKPLSNLGEKCIASWKKHLPDYKIMRWDEDNFDVNSVLYTKESYHVKKYAFVSDYVRYKVLYDFGGVYMDTDVEVIRNLYEFLDNEAFSGFEDEYMVAPGLILGSIKGNSLMKDMMEKYLHTHFIKPDHTYNLTTCPQNLTELLLSRGLERKDVYQKISGLSIYPKEYFCPKSWITRKLEITANTYTIHHYEGSWLPKLSKFQKFKKYIRNLLGILKSKILKF